MTSKADRNYQEFKRQWDIVVRRQEKLLRQRDIAESRNDRVAIAAINIRLDNGDTSTVEFAAEDIAYARGR